MKLVVTLALILAFSPGEKEQPLSVLPEVTAKLEEPNAKGNKLEDVVKEAEQAAVLVLVY